MKKRIRKKYKWAFCQYHSCLCLSEPCKLGKKSCSNSWQCKNFTVMRQEMVLGRPNNKKLIKECEDGYVGIYAGFQLFSEQMDWSDACPDTCVSEYEAVQTVTYKPKKCHS